MQAGTRVKAEQASKKGNAEADPFRLPHGPFASPPGGALPDRHTERWPAAPD